MPVPPLHPNINFNSYISGEVMIHPTATIAPGVILQASINSRILIGAGVAIGMGSILQVNEGILEVETGATIGAGVLLIGKVKIGANACIGSATTILNHSIDPGQVVVAGSLIGDTSRQLVEVTTSAKTDSVTEVTVANTSPNPPNSAESTLDLVVQESSGNSHNQVVYGQKSVKHLLSTLFPYKQPLIEPGKEGK